MNFFVAFLIVLAALLLFLVVVLRTRIAELFRQGRRIIELEAQVRALQGQLQSTVPVYYGNEIAAKLEELREGASEIRAIWSGEYGVPVVEEYFRKEAEGLEKDPNLTITRLVSENAVPPPQRGSLNALVERYRNQLRVHRTDVKEYEHFIVDQPGQADQVAMFIINKPIEQTPTVGLLFDPNANTRLGVAVEAIIGWFGNLVQSAVSREQEAATARQERAKATKTKTANGESALRVWREDHKADTYENLVDHNALNIGFLGDYQAQEQELLESKLKQWSDSSYGENKKLTIVEIGCGTARSLLQLPAVGHFDNKFEYIIGFDFSREMLRVAHRAWRQAKDNRAVRPPAWGTLSRFRLYDLDVMDMNTYFINGEVKETKALDERLYAGELQLAESADKVSDITITELDDGAFKASSRVFICLLNTIGVILDRARDQALQRMLMGLGTGDRLVISVFDADVFAQEARPLYTKIRELTGDFDEAQAFNDEDAVFDTGEYFSRWFKLNDLKNRITALARNAGLAVDVQSAHLAAGGHFLFITRTR